MEHVDNKTERPLAHYRALLAQADPLELASKGMASYSEVAHTFTLAVMGRTFFIRWPEGEVLTTPIYLAPAPEPQGNKVAARDNDVADAKTTPSVVARLRAEAPNGAHGTLKIPEISPELSILLLRIVLEGVALPAHTRFLAYQELPRGAAYLPAFNRRCTQRLTREYEEAQELSRACENLGATSFESRADAAYQFEFLPNVFVQFIFWEGDDEFPSQAQILFSDNVTACFTSEDMVVISEIIIRALALGYVI